MFDLLWCRDSPALTFIRIDVMRCYIMMIIIIGILAIIMEIKYINVIKIVTKEDRIVNIIFNVMWIILGIIALIIGR